jgi:transposase
MFKRRFAEMEPVRIAIETGTHSPWVSRLLEDAGHEVLVANARELGFIYKNSRKNDRLDAENLVLGSPRIARLDPKLLSPIEHRGEEAQADLALLRTRDVLVKSRPWLAKDSSTICAGRSRRLEHGCLLARPRASISKQ